MAKVTMKNEIAKYDANILDNIGKEGEMYSLNDLWNIAGSPDAKRPNDWQGTQQGRNFIESACKILNAAKNGIMKSKRGKGGGTYGVKQIALEYAQYLDSDLAVLVNEVFFERIQEENNPDLIVDRAIKTYKRKGRDDKWIEARFKGKAKRNEFTNCLADHGVINEGFRDCTNAIYTPLYGGTTALIRAKKQLPKNVNIRDNMNETELLAVQFAEHLSKLTIEKENLEGNIKCKMACNRSSNIVANALRENSIKL